MAGRGSYAVQQAESFSIPQHAIQRPFRNSLQQGIIFLVDVFCLVDDNLYKDIQTDLNKHLDKISSHSNAGAERGIAIRPKMTQSAEEPSHGCTTL